MSQGLGESVTGEGRSQPAADAASLLAEALQSSKSGTGAKLTVRLASASMLNAYLQHNDLSCSQLSSLWWCCCNHTTGDQSFALISCRPTLIPLQACSGPYAHIAVCLQESSACSHAAASII